MSLKMRLASAERALNEAGADLTIIHIRGGLDHETSGDRASAGDVAWTREADEDPLAFRARCEQAAREMGAKILIFGGPRPTTWSNHNGE
jgi:hypothetical protein